MNHVDREKEPDVFLAVVRGRIMGLTQPEAYAAARMRMTPDEYRSIMRMDFASQPDQSAIAIYNCRCRLLNVAFIPPDRSSFLNLANV